jgi:hypothetical protein
MTSNEEKREITVKAPSKPVTSPQEKERKSSEKALEEERFSALQFPKKISKYFSFIVMATGVLLLFAIAFTSATGQTSTLLFSTETNLPSIVLWGFVALINIIAGFFFLGRE